MTLVRKHGHEEFAVYRLKLRSKTPGTDLQFQQAIRLLSERGCVSVDEAMVYMTATGASMMYHPRWVGGLEDPRTFGQWEEIIRELDDILVR